MSWRYPLSQYDAAQTVATAMEITCVIHNTILILYHIYHISRDKKSKTTSKLQCLSLLTISLSILTRICAILSSFSLHPRFMTCQTWMNILGVNYSITKLSLYFLLLERLFAVFYVAKYKFRPWAIYTSRILLIIYAILISCLSFGSGEGYYVPEKDICVANFPFWALGIVAFGDACIIVILSILFTRRLMLLSIPSHPDVDYSESKTETSHIPQNKVVIQSLHQDREMLKLMKRLQWLTIVALFTTFISLVLTALFELASLWISLDMIVNSYCIMLMFKVHNWLYGLMCNSLENGVMSDGCLSCYSLNLCCPVSSNSESYEIVNGVEMKMSTCTAVEI